MKKVSFSIRHILSGDSQKAVGHPLGTSWKRAKHWMSSPDPQGIVNLMEIEEGSYLKAQEEQIPSKWLLLLLVFRG